MSTLALNELLRQEALAAFDILDTPQEGEFDEIVQLAAQLCGAPIATMTLVDRDRQWFKAKVGWTSKAPVANGHSVPARSISKRH